jgi:hypothetical protein
MVIDLKRKNTTPIELILLLEADLLDDEGALGIVFDWLRYIGFKNRG